MNRRTKERRASTNALYEAISNCENAKLQMSLEASENEVSMLRELLAEAGDALMAGSKNNTAIISAIHNALPKV